MVAAVESMVYVRDVPWHGLGRRVEKPMTVIEALEYSGLDWEVKPETCYFEKEDGIFDIVPGIIANVRATDKRVLGTVTTRYKIVQNSQAFEVIEHIMDAVGKQFIETAGALFGGRQVFILGRLEGCTALGDQIDPYLVFKNSHDGSSIVEVAVTPIRVVCNNTLTMALEGSRRKWGCSHTGDIQSKIAEAQETLRRAADYMKAFPEFAKIMVDVNLYDDDIPELMEALFPLPEDPSPLTIKNNEWRKQTLYNLYTSVEDIAKFEGTAWGMYNAVSDYCTHIRPIKETPSWRENLFSKAVEVNRLLVVAQKMLMQVKQ